MKAHVLDINHVVSVCQRRCDDLGVSVEWCPYANTAYTNGQKITLPVPSLPVSHEQLDTLYGMVIHECGHHLRPAAFDILRAATPPEHLCALYNIIEDDGMERERALEWRGDRSALARMNSILIRDASEGWATHFKGGGDMNQPPEPLAALCTAQTSRLEWDHDTEPYLNSLLKVLPTEARELYEDLIKEGWHKKMQATETEHDTWDVAVDLAKRLYPDRDQDEYEEIRQAGHSKQGERDDSDTSMPDPTGRGGLAGKATEEEGDSAQTQSAQIGDDPADSGDRGEGQTISWKDCVVSEHNEWSEGGENPGNLGITWDGYKTGGGAKFLPLNQVNVLDLKSGKPNQWSNGRDFYMPSDEHSRAFANRIRRYIQSKARSTVQRERHEGKIDKGMIVRLGMPPIDGGEWNRRIFYDQRKHTMKDTAIFVLVDWSGSMSGRKMKYAADAAQRLVWCFDRVLNVPVALAAFSNRRSLCDIGYIKPYNTRGMTAEKIADRFNLFENYSSGNNDGDSVNWAYHEIMKRKESRKILIVLSDGAPTGSFAGGADASLRKITNEIESANKVELYGVGICSQAVERYYTNYKVINDPSEINDTLFRLIKDGNNV